MRLSTSKAQTNWNWLCGTKYTVCACAVYVQCTLGETHYTRDTIPIKNNFLFQQNNVSWIRYFVVRSFHFPSDLAGVVDLVSAKFHNNEKCATLSWQLMHDIEQFLLFLWRKIRNKLEKKRLIWRFIVQIVPFRQWQQTDPYAFDSMNICKARTTIFVPFSSTRV